MLWFLQALQRMREYEQRLAESDSVEAHNESIGLNIESGGASSSTRVHSEGATLKEDLSEAVSSSAQGSDTSTSDVPVRMENF